MVSIKGKHHCKYLNILLRRFSLSFMTSAIYEIHKIGQFMKILVIKPMEELLITLTCFITLFNQTEIRRCTEKRFQVTKLLLSLLFVYLRQQRLRLYPLNSSLFGVILDLCNPITLSAIKMLAKNVAVCTFLRITNTQLLLIQCFTCIEVNSFENIMLVN